MSEYVHHYHLIVNDTLFFCISDLKSRVCFIYTVSGQIPKKFFITFWRPSRTTTLLPASAS